MSDVALRDLAVDGGRRGLNLGRVLAVGAICDSALDCTEEEDVVKDRLFIGGGIRPALTDFAIQEIRNDPWGSLGSSSFRKSMISGSGRFFSSVGTVGNSSSSSTSRPNARN
jgi:hypothetical protein